MYRDAGWNTLIVCFREAVIECMTLPGTAEHECVGKHLNCHFITCVIGVCENVLQGVQAHHLSIRHPLD